MIFGLIVYVNLNYYTSFLCTESSEGRIEYQFRKFILMHLFCRNTRFLSVSSRHSLDITDRFYLFNAYLTEETIYPTDNFYFKMVTMLSYVAHMLAKENDRIWVSFLKMHYETLKKFYKRDLSLPALMIFL